MRRSIVLAVLLVPVFVTGCNLFSFLSPTPIESQSGSHPHLLGEWNLILHMETLENELIPMRLNIREISCLNDICTLDGFIESDWFNKEQRSGLKEAFYHPSLNMLKFTYRYKTIDGKNREAIVIFDDFPSMNVPDRSMGGYIVIFDLDSRSIFLTPEDKQILEATRKGKAVQAGQVTAWPSLTD